MGLHPSVSLKSSFQTMQYPFSNYQPFRKYIKHGPEFVQPLESLQLRGMPD